jgi:hypothetical protein
MDHGSIDHGFTALGGGLVVFTEPSILPQPSEGSFDDPPTRQDDEPFLLPELSDDLDSPTELLFDPFDELSGVTPIGPQKGKPHRRGGAVRGGAVRGGAVRASVNERAEPIFQSNEKGFGSLGILNTSGVDRSFEDQPLSVDDEMTLPTLHLLPSVVTEGLLRLPLFSAVSGEGAASVVFTD